MANINELKSSHGKYHDNATNGELGREDRSIAFEN